MPFTAPDNPSHPIFTPEPSYNPWTTPLRPAPSPAGTTSNGNPGAPNTAKPAQNSKAVSPSPEDHKWRNMDAIGVGVLGALVLSALLNNGHPQGDLKNGVKLLQWK